MGGEPGADTPASDAEKKVDAMEEKREISCAPSTSKYNGSNDTACVQTSNDEIKKHSEVFMTDSASTVRRLRKGQSCRQAEMSGTRRFPEAPRRASEVSSDGSKPLEQGGDSLDVLSPNNIDLADQASEK